MASKRWTFQLEGRDRTVEVRWNPFTGSGQVYLDAKKISQWPAPIVFKSHTFRLGNVSAELKRTDGGGSMNLVKDMDLWIEGRNVQELPLPGSLEAPQVVDTHQSPCSKCQASALVLVYTNGNVDVVCPKCGRFTIG